MCRGTHDTHDNENQMPLSGANQFSDEGPVERLALFRIRDGHPFSPWQWPGGPLFIPQEYAFRLLSQHILHRTPPDGSYDVESAQGLQRYRSDLLFLRQFITRFSPSNCNHPRIHPDDALRIKEIVLTLQLEWATTNDMYVHADAAKLPGWTCTLIVE
jgi:hypothetical protein